jgi:hypothetical protein
MSGNAEFYRRHEMTARETILFEKCPLCGRAEISMEKRGLFRFYKAEIKPCPSCLAEFAERGGNNFELMFCEPRKLVGHHECRDRVVNGCYLGLTLSRSEWKRIADGVESSDLAKFMEVSARFRRGSLPTCPSENLPFHLEGGEIIHYVSFPVYVHEQRAPRLGEFSKGRLFLTSRRIVYESPSAAFTVRLENVERVDEAAPGFIVKEKDSYEPRHFFPSLYDPVYAAVQGAIRNLRRRS